MTRYGSHPDFVFGVHYGFVPPLLEQRGSCYTVLRFDQALRGGGSSGAGGGSVGGGGGSVGSSVGGGGDGAACGAEEGLGIEEGLGAEAVREAQLASEESSDGEPGWCEWSEAEVRHSTCMPLTAHACPSQHMHACAVRVPCGVPCMCHWWLSLPERKLNHLTSVCLSVTKDFTDFWISTCVGHSGLRGGAAHRLDIGEPLVR